MSAFLVSPEADEDIWSIWRYLAEKSGVSGPNRIEADLFNAFETLARTPGIGHRRADLTSHPVFFFAVYRYMIVYRTSAPLEIATVIHGKRDVERILEKRAF